MCLLLHCFLVVVFCSDVYAGPTSLQLMASPPSKPCSRCLVYHSIYCILYALKPIGSHYWHFWKKRPLLTAAPTENLFSRAVALRLRRGPCFPPPRSVSVHWPHWLWNAKFWIRCSSTCFISFLVFSYTRSGYIICKAMSIWFLAIESCPTIYHSKTHVMLAAGQKFLYVLVWWHF